MTTSLFVIAVKISICCGYLEEEEQAPNYEVKPVANICAAEFGIA